MELWRFNFHVKWSLAKLIQKWHDNYYTRPPHFSNTIQMLNGLSGFDNFSVLFIFYTTFQLFFQISRVFGKWICNVIWFSFFSECYDYYPLLIKPSMHLINFFFVIIIIPPKHATHFIYANHNPILPRKHLNHVLNISMDITVVKSCTTPQYDWTQFQCQGLSYTQAPIFTLTP